MLTKVRFVTFRVVNSVSPSDAVRKQKKISLEDLFNSVLSQFQKCYPYGNLKFDNLGISEA